MLSTLLGDGVELNPLKRVVIERTEGNPFFIEEMVQTLFDEGALVRNGAVKVMRSLSQLRLPPTVQGWANTEGGQTAQASIIVSRYKNCAI